MTSCRKDTEIFLLQAFAKAFHFKVTIIQENTMIGPKKKLHSNIYSTTNEQTPPHIFFRTYTYLVYKLTNAKFVILVLEN